MVDQLSVESAWTFDMQHVLGPHFRRALIGLQEASERLSNEDNLHWIRWSPLLARENLLPNVSCRNPK